MKRKHFVSSLLLSITLTIVAVFPSAAGAIEPMSKEQLSALTEKEAGERVLQLSGRINEIKDMQHSKLPKPERKEIKSEMREIKKELDFLNDRVTLSIGALIIIILLIILIF